jgi:lactoylglutathione lyase
MPGIHARLAGPDDRRAASRRRADRLAVNGRDPEQASCWFSVGDVDALWREYEAKGIGPGIVDEQQYDGKPYRVFFAKEPYGVCFCFTQPL